MTIRDPEMLLAQIMNQPEVSLRMVLGGAAWLASII